MSKKVRNTLIALVVMIVTYAVVIPLTTWLPPAGMGVLHAGISIVFLVWFFRIWSTFKQPAEHRMIWSIMLIALFIIVLPAAINLVAALPIVLKGIAHLAVILIFFVAFLIIWKKP